MADKALEEIFQRIPERDQAALRQHGITSLSMLLDKKSQFQQRGLKNVCADVQMVLDVVCTYMESLESITSFTWESFENFCEFVDNSGDKVLDFADEIRQMKKTADEEADPEGYNLTNEERQQMDAAVDNDPLTMMVRGFSAPTLQFEMDENNKKQLVDDPSRKTEVAFNGFVYYVNRCYHYQQENGANVIVGIKAFTKNEKKAIVALVVPFFDTILGPGLEEEPPIGVQATHEEERSGVPTHVQVREKPGLEPIIPLSSLKPSTEITTMPALMFERQQLGQPPMNFGYVYENDGNNRGEEREGDIRFIDLFAGSGGFHQGVTQVPGFKGVAAVEYWRTAWYVQYMSCVHCKSFRSDAQILNSFSLLQ